jgi:hypothetical protein
MTVLEASDKENPRISLFTWSKFGNGSWELSSNKKNGTIYYHVINLSINYSFKK